MQQSKALFRRAQQYIPGGVNSPVRAFSGVGGDPVFIRQAKGAYLFDVENHRYIDYVGSWGPMILGHAHPKVLAAVQKAAVQGLSFGAPTEVETRMAERLCALVPSMEQVRMVNSGTEATMSAIRLARGYTGRDKILKFEGCYHGHADSLLVKAGSGALTLGVPSSPGIPKNVAELTLTIAFNDLEQLQNVFQHWGEQLACVIVEPVAGNMNCIPPIPGFLEALCDLCQKYGTVSIFDEVMTGFRVALGGAQARYNLHPDMTTLGKVIGGGLPVGAFGGKADIMANIAPEGPVYQAGTLSGNPIALVAGLCTLDQVSQPDFYRNLETKTNQLVAGLLEQAQAAKVAMSANVVGGMFGLFFGANKSVRHYSQVMACDIDRFRRFFHGMLAEGVYFAPSAFEAGFMSSAHSQDDIEATIAAAGRVLAQI